MRRQARVRIFTDKNSLDHFRHGQIDFAARLVARARPETEAARHPPSGQARGQAFRDHALDFEWYRAARDLRGRQRSLWCLLR